MNNRKGLSFVEVSILMMIGVFLYFAGNKVVDYSTEVKNDAIEYEKVATFFRAIEQIFSLPDSCQSSLSRGASVEDEKVSVIQLYNEQYKSVPELRMINYVPSSHSIWISKMESEKISYDSEGKAHVNLKVEVSYKDSKKNIHRMRRTFPLKVKIENKQIVHCYAVVEYEPTYVFDRVIPSSEDEMVKVKEKLDEHCQSLFLSTCEERKETLAEMIDGQQDQFYQAICRRSGREWNSSLNRCDIPEGRFK